MLPRQKEGGRDRQVDLRKVINALNYRTRTGCAWEMLPHDFPPKSTVYEYYRAWQRDGTWQTLHDALRRKVRQQEGRSADASAGMLDSQSVKTTETPGERGYDAGKKVNGRKRHLLVDTLSLDYHRGHHCRFGARSGRRQACVFPNQRSTKARKSLGRRRLSRGVCPLGPRELCLGA